ncbi:MAG: amino acid adenylation domain-containing protein [Planctomycetota bacterium]|jgi:amino acid adenylation domain-containing protein
MTGLLQDAIARQARSRPDAVAVVLGEERLTYGELEAASNRLAHRLKQSGCRRGDRVCFVLPKSPWAITSILGILKADCVYTPIDLDSPAPRVAKILASCRPRLLLAGDPAARLLDALQPDLPLGWLGVGARPGAAFDLGDLEAMSPAPLASRNEPSDPAYIFFTSGSTGTPKGVVITHRNVTAFVEWANGYFGVDATDRCSAHSPLHFDLSTYDIFGTLAAGAELHLVPPGLNLMPNKLAEFIRAAELTQWFSVPSILNYMAKLDVVRPDDFPALKRVLWCGEVFPTPGLVYWMEKLPKVQFTNLYGPTETTIASSYHTVPACPADPRTEVPIGLPCAGEDLHVLDAQLAPLPTGEVGDLYIGGVGLSPGYWEDEEKTRAAFRTSGGRRVYNTGDLARVGSDGLVYYIGRSDTQIKSRGYRIELGEIESALHALTTLEESAVVAVETGGFEGAAICCAYAPLRGSELRPLDLKQQLAKVLPKYMLPFRWKQLGQLPKNANGKIDRRALKTAFLEEFGTSDARTVGDAGPR